MSASNILSEEDARLEPQADLGRLQRWGLIVGVVGAVASAIGFATNPAVFYRAYWTGWLLWVSVAVGLLALGMLNHLSGGRWGVIMRRVFEASGRTILFFALAAVPVALRLPMLFPWADPERVAHDALVQKKVAYLNPEFFLARGVGFLVIWWLLGMALSRLSHRQDATGDPRLRTAMQRLSAIGLIFFALSATFASVDWIMSLEPHWFSSLFGFAFAAGAALAGFSFSVPMLLFLGGRKPVKGVVAPVRFHDYGKLMLAFTMFWGYMTVSQYLIIWSGNLPEEITWYLARNTQGWHIVTIFLVVGHFFFPFLLLLSAEIKRKPKRLGMIALWLLIMRWLDLHWQVAPSVLHWQHEKGLLGEQAHLAFHWLDLAAVAAIGGLWFALLIGQLKNRAVLPVQDPILQEVMAHG